MIYSKEIEKRCGLCRYAAIENDDSCYCTRKKKNVSAANDTCRKFSYDILKRTTRRKKPLSSTFTPSDFTL